MSTFIVTFDPALKPFVVETDGWETQPTPLPLTNASWVSPAAADGNSTAATAVNATTATTPALPYFFMAQAQRVGAGMQAPTVSLSLSPPRSKTQNSPRRVLSFVPQKPGYYPILARQPWTGGAQVGIFIKVGEPEGPVPTLPHTHPLKVPSTVIETNALDVAAKVLPEKALENRPVTRKMHAQLVGEYLWFPEFGIKTSFKDLASGSSSLSLRGSGSSDDDEDEDEDEMQQWFLLQEHAFQKQASSGDPSDVITINIDPTGKLPSNAINLAPRGGSTSGFGFNDTYSANASMISDKGIDYDRRVRWGHGHHLAVPCDTCMRCLNYDSVPASEQPALRAECNKAVDTYLWGYGMNGYDSTMQILSVTCSAWTDGANVTKEEQCADWHLSKDPVIKPNSNPLEMCFGDRVELVIQNSRNHSKYSKPDGHPIHLHGTTAQITKLVDTDGTEHDLGLEGPRRDTFYIPINGSATVQFDAVNPGNWMLHCHIDDHAEGGMMSSIRYLTPSRCSSTLGHGPTGDDGGAAVGFNFLQAPGSRFQEWSTPVGSRTP